MQCSLPRKAGHSIHPSGSVGSDGKDDARQSLSLVREIIDCCPAPILICRLSDDRILFESAAVRDLLKCRDTRIGASVTGQWVSARDYDAFKRRLFDTEARSLAGCEVRLQRNDGVEFWCSISARIIAVQGEDVIYMSLLDLTEHHAAQAEIARQRDSLHDAEKLSSLGEVLAGVSHELNNPLSVLAGQALMLKEKAPDEATAARAARICRAAERCSRIVRSFLALARQQPDAPVPLALNEIVHEALEVASHQLRPVGANVTLELSRNVPNVLGNPDQLRQVVVNMITNAGNALETVEGRRVITIKTIHDKAEKLVMVKVTDNGPGVPEQHRSRIFEPLFTTRAPGKGTGIGLSLCRRIMASHHGTIQLASASALGSTFVASLPQIDEAPTLTLSGALSAKKHPDRLDILIVDNDPETARRLAEIVANDGHGVEVVETGFIGLERLTRRSYAAIFCRLGLDGTDGRNFFGSLNETLPEMTHRVVFVTNASLGKEAIGYLDWTQRPYITSPLQRNAVREVIELLSMRAASQDQKMKSCSTSPTDASSRWTRKVCLI